MSLFAHLAFQFSASPENLATEALAYILRSPVAREALLGRLQGAGLKLPPDLSFRTQAFEEGTIPDLAGQDHEGRDLLLFEAKFWAGLTKNQPGAYLRRLPTDATSLLLFIAPAARLETLWPELQRLAGEIGETRKVGVDFHVASVDATRHLGIISWRALLAALRGGLEAAGERGDAQQVEQLQGLCERMDSIAFQPLQSSELAPWVGHRVLQFMDLVDDLKRRLIESGVGDDKGLRMSPARNYYRQYVRLKNYGCSIGLEFKSWAEVAETPLWLCIWEEERNPTEEIWRQLSSLLGANPPRAFRQADRTYVPLYLKTNVDRDMVLSDLEDQIHEVIALFPEQENQP